MELRPQDVVVCLKLASLANEVATYAQLGAQLYMSPSEVHGAIRRAVAARLIRVDTPLKTFPPSPRNRSKAEHGGRRSFTEHTHVNRTALLEFLIHGVKYAFPAQRGPLTRGLPTGYAAPPLNKTIVLS